MKMYSIPNRESIIYCLSYPALWLMAFKIFVCNLTSKFNNQPPRGRDNSE